MKLPEPQISLSAKPQGPPNEQQRPPLRPLEPPPPERFPLVKFDEIKAANGASYLVKASFLATASL